MNPARNTYLLSLVLALASSACVPTHDWKPTALASGPIRPPRPVMPPADARVTTERPTLLWLLAPGTDGARIELCRDSDCREILRTIDVPGTHLQLARELPLGDVYWRLRGRSSGRVGAGVSETRLMNVDVRTVHRGRYVEITLPKDEGRLGAQLVALGDRAVARYAALLGVSPPKEPIPVTALTTRKGMNAIFEEGAPGEHGQRVGGLTQFGAKAIYFLLPRLAGTDAVLPDGAPYLKWSFLHELLHAVQFRGAKNASDQPVWFSEGLADRLAEDVLVEHPATVDLRAAGFLRKVREAVGTTRFIPLDKLLTLSEADLHAENDQQFALIYAESFSLNRFLDSGPRRVQYRALLPEITHMSRVLLPTRIAHRVRELFGDLAILQSQWLAAVQAVSLPPWHEEYAGDVSLLSDGGLAMVSERQRRVAAIRTDAPLALPTNLRFSVDVEALDELELMFSIRGEDRFSIVVLPQSGYVGLYEVNRADWSRRTRGSRVELNPGSHHDLLFTFTADSLRVQLDGRTVIGSPIAPKLGSPTSFGVALFNGQAVVRDIQIEPVRGPLAAAGSGSGLDAAPLHPARP